ncbi:iron reductase [Cylindrobasidium torrendii FP15055 ss-10]|uniref:Iron reductase n=1 Tax=Cylindrobasidium torrendii FP15055 ss-10 TaxID=1314674 RepID=A0A0D7B385_9AGAR|nr:iron reductase [Cylindrobasidium torrendii FP15055 ss-10]
MSAPQVPDELKQYNSYVTDPLWQRRFTSIWGAFLGVAVVCSLPYLLKSVRNRRLFLWYKGIGEHAKASYSPLTEKESVLPNAGRRNAFASVMRNAVLWAPPGIGLHAGQMLLVAVYYVVVLICLLMDSELKTNANRAGFMAIAQLPIVFLFAAKNSPVSLLLGPGHGYEKLNYVHRWASRSLFLCAVIHGALWIDNHRRWHIKILGATKETYGIAALAVLCVIVLTSVRWARSWSYETFFLFHVVGFVSFFVVLCYHTPYARPWIFPPIAFYALDISMRMLRIRIKDAELKAVDGQMTLINVRDSDCGWEAGQHVRVRVFFNSRVFESHPLSIACAPRNTTCLSSSSDSLILGARVRGDWTKALNVYAKEAEEKQVQVMLDGPYGGSSIDLGEYENILLFAGGSGATVTIGLLDDIVGRCVRLGRRGGERTRRISFVWCVRSFGSIEWFSRMLQEIASVADASVTLDLHVAVYVTCLCNPEAVPRIPNSDVVVGRPAVGKTLMELITPPTGEREVGAHVDPEGEADATSKLPWIGLGGGVGVVACGPESLTREATNAVARLSITRGVELGGIDLHTEEFSA